MEVSNDLKVLAENIANWADTIPVITTVYLFGSRARGDHRKDSDVDLRIDFDFTRPSEDFYGWLEANDNDFADLKAILPGPLALHQDETDAALPEIQRAAKNPIFQTGKVVCVNTPPKS